MAAVIYTIVIPGELRGKGRPRFARHSGAVRTFTDAQTVSAENLVKTCAVEQIGQPNIDGPVSLHIEAHVPIPKSWSKAKSAAALANTIKPTGRPDCDNCIKLIADSLNRIAWRDDAQVFQVSMLKRFTGKAPSTIIKIMAAEDAR